MCESMVGKKTVTCTHSLALHAGVACWRTIAVTLAAAIAIALLGPQGSFMDESLHAVKTRAPLQGRW